MNRRSRALLILAFSVLSLVLTVWLMAYSHKQHRKRICNDLTINIDYRKSDVFIIDEDIEKRLMSNQLHPVGKSLQAFNPTDIEQNLKQHSAVNDVQVYVQLNGEVDIDVLQHQPIARLENLKGEQFYLTQTGNCMALDRRYTTRLLVVNGHLKDAFDPARNVNADEPETKESTLKEIYQLVNYINNDEFFKALIDQIYVLPNQEFELISKTGNHVILFGKADNYPDKFDRLQMFYKYGIKKTGWDLYKTINLKYSNQVICTKV